MRTTALLLANLMATVGMALSDLPPSESTGSVSVSIQDEFTFFMPGAPLVAGAHVVIYDVAASMVFADGYSDATGVFHASDIPAGTHGIAVSATGHALTQFTIAVTAGSTSSHSVFISRQTGADNDGDGVFSPYDCNDADPNIHPGASETCDDGVDNDCDGVVDEVPPCITHVLNDYRTIASGTWSNATIWERYDGAAFVPAAFPPSASDASIVIRTGHNVNVTAPVVLDQTIVESGASISQGADITVQDGPGDDFLVRGSYSMSGNLHGAGHVVVASGGAITVIAAVIQPSAVVDIQAGGTFTKNGSTSEHLRIVGTINNAGTFNMNGARLGGGSTAGPSAINNLAGGVFNLNGWWTAIPCFLNGYFYNAGTLHKYGAVAINFSPSRFTNLPSGSVVHHEGSFILGILGLDVPTTEQFGSFTVMPGASMNASGNLGLQFSGTNIHNDGSIVTNLVTFRGQHAQTVTGTGTIHRIQLENPDGVDFTGAQMITQSVNMLNGVVRLAANDLIIAPACTFTSGNEASHIVTNGMGRLVRTVSNNSADVFFPVGTTSAYAPLYLRLSNASTTDVFGVRAQEAVSDAYDANGMPTGNSLSEHWVRRTWSVQEAISGASDATLTAQWNAADEHAAFDRTQCTLLRHDGAAWSPEGYGPASGSGPYTRQRSGLTAFGVFGVADVEAPLISTGCTSDADNDGTCDDVDGCPADALKTAPGACGCGIADTDTDNDGTPDCFEGVSNDPLSYQQWNLTDLRAPQVWPNSTGSTTALGQRITVGIMDTEVLTAHPDLQANIWPASAMNSSVTASHGTEVGSVVAAVRDNGIGISGVAPGAQLMALGTSSEPPEDLAQLEQYRQRRALFNSTNGAEGELVVAITMAFGFPESGGGPAPGIFTRLQEAGVLLLTGGPNTLTDIDVSPEAPSSLAAPNNIVVSAIGPTGETPFAYGDSTVHLLAPGLQIPTTAGDGTYTLAAGTSVAIPHVAGAVALLYGVPCPQFAQLVLDQPWEAARLVRDAILNNTTPVSGADTLTRSGGKLNVEAAYNALMAQCGQFCETVTITFSPANGAVTENQLSSTTDGGTITTGTGNVITACLAEGCFRAGFYHNEGPAQGTYTITDAQGTTIASGSADAEGNVHFILGSGVLGCTNPSAGNYDPSATCDDGSCCSTNVRITLYDSGGDGWEGAEYTFATASGSIISTGTLPSGTSAVVDLPCQADGCYLFRVSGGDDRAEVSWSLSRGTIQSGGANAHVSFTLGNAVGGCTDPSAVNYNALATCDDGSCCSNILAQLIVAPLGPSATASVDYMITNNGNALIGTLPLIASDGQGSSVAGILPLCLDTGCVSIVITTEGPALNAYASLQLPDGNQFVFDPLQPFTAFVGPTANGLDLCDGFDNDCDGTVDEDGLYADADGDGFGDALALVPCGSNSAVTNADDCNDDDASVHPGAIEICDLLDNNCDGAVDEGFYFFLDADGDGLGRSDSLVHACAPGPGMATVDGDCDDGNAQVIGPASIQLLTNDPFEEGTAFYTVTTDHGSIDGTIMLDADHEGVGTARFCLSAGCFTITITANDVALDPESVFRANADAEAIVFDVSQAFTNSIGVQEVCDGIDNDCDGQVDENGCPSCSAADRLVLAQALRIESGQLTGPLMNAAVTCYSACTDGEAAPQEIETCTMTCLAEPFELAPTCLQCFTAYLVCYNEANGFGCAPCITACVTAFMNCSGLADADGDGFFAGHDCDDANNTVHPGAVEVCDGLDNDCDGDTDELNAFLDEDGDGFGNPLMQVSCAVAGSVLNNTDCDDTDPGLYPGGPVPCPACSPEDIATILNDPALLNNSIGCLAGCFNSPDRALCVSICVQEQYGLDISCAECLAQRVLCIVEQCAICVTQPGSAACQACLATSSCNTTFGSCSGIVDSDGDGVIDPLDCEDQDATVYPGAPELCDGRDNDCDGQVDEGAQAIAYRDVDGDGYGDLAQSSTVCPMPNGYVTAGGDCDDTDPTVNPGTIEICDGTDNNCNGFVDDLFAWYADADGDGYGEEVELFFGCAIPTSGATALGGDCDDQDAAVHPGTQEVCDGRDNDCNGATDEGLLQFADLDGDGLGDPASQVPCGTGVPNANDCDDADPAPCTDPQAEVPHHHVIGSTGGSAQLGTYHMAWTVGEPMVTLFTDGNLQLTQGFHQNAPILLRMNLRAFLQGPFNSGNGLMSDTLRRSGLVPLEEPYTAIGYLHTSGGGETCTSSALALGGTDGVVDWVVVELRDTLDPTHVIESRSALLQRDGDVVGTDGTSAVRFSAPAGPYRISLLHRNHLPVITAVPVDLVRTQNVIDLSDGSTPLFGQQPTAISGTVHLLWCGDVNADGVLMYTGADNDRDRILLHIGGTVPTNMAYGYRPEDVNLDGAVKYTGAANDRDPILLNIGGTVPTNVRTAQMP